MVIGSGGIAFPGWVMTDLPFLDALNETHWRNIFSQNCIDRILMEHVIEHWTIDEFRRFLDLAKPYLSETGQIRIAVPDGLHPDPRYIDLVKPGGSGLGAADHKVLYTHQKIEEVARSAGYRCVLKEYFDEQGTFHQNAWDAADGPIRRSADNDPRNQEVPLTYTSLIADLMPFPQSPSTSQP